MPVTAIHKGLDIPIDGKLSSNTIVNGPAMKEVAMIPFDSIGIKPKLLVKVGDQVQIGSELFCNRDDVDAIYTSPAAGEVIAINRGARRKILSIVIQVAEKESAVNFGALDPKSASRDDIKSLLLKSGLWPSFRMRPFDRAARTSDTPSSIFITAMDTRPLAPAVEAVLAGNEKAFRCGAMAVAKLIDGPTYVCTAKNSKSDAFQADGVQNHEFSGAHPAGNVGVHINALDAVGAGKIVWHIGYQDVVAIGQLMLHGKFPTEQIVALVGPSVKECQLIRTRRGAKMETLIGDNLTNDHSRVISGSVLCGRTANVDAVDGFLSRYDNQVTVLEEAMEREFIGWMLPGENKHSFTNVFAGKFLKKVFNMNTSKNGSHRAIVPIGVYEEVMPMDIEPTFLIKALASGDMEMAEKLGVLELSEEDVALCEYVCPSKHNITGDLRDMLTRIEKEE